MDLDSSYNKSFDMFLLFQIAGERYAIDAMSVLRIADYRESFDLPSIGGVFDKAVELDGTMIPLFKLDNLLMVEHGSNPRTLVVRGANESVRLSFYVDEVVVTISSKAEDVMIKRLPDVFEDELLAEVIRHCLIQNGEIIPIVEPYRLLK